MADMMKQMGQGKGMLGKMFGGKAAPDAAEMEKMQAELAAMDPNALPADLRDLVQGSGAGSGAAMPDLSKLMGGGMPKLPGLGGLPGLGSGFKGLPGLGKKK
jgi:signal recognition particle subunit SRP54